MPHIHTGYGQHDATSSAYIVLLEEGKDARLWLHRHKKLHKWLQFGGHIELAETPWQALVHEVQEESGYNLPQLKILQPKNRLKWLSNDVLHPQFVAESTHVFPAAEVLHYHTDRAYAFVTSQLPQNSVADGESQNIKAMTVAEINALDPSDIPSSTREIAVYILETVLSEYEEVDPTVFEL